MKRLIFSAVVLIAIWIECDAGNWIEPCQISKCSRSCGGGTRTVNYTICNSTGVNDTCDPRLQNLQTVPCEVVPCPSSICIVKKNTKCNKTNTDYMNFIPCFKNLNIDEEILNASIKLLTKWNADYVETRYKECNCDESRMNLMILEIEDDLEFYLSPTQNKVQLAKDQVKDILDCMPGVPVDKVWDVYDTLIEKAAILANVDIELHIRIDFLKNAIETCKGKGNPLEYIKTVIRSEL